MNKIYKILDWDTDFFQRKIASINGCEVDEELIDNAIHKLFKQGIECIYLIMRKPFNTEKYDIVLADRKRTYIHSIPEYKELKYLEEITIQSPIYDGNSSDLYGLAIQSGEYSRFKVDTHFSTLEFENLYKKWVDNSVNGDFADYVIVAMDSLPRGLITGKIYSDKIIIGLFATDHCYRGRGIGSLLMQKILNEAADKSLKVEVVTQADNRHACTFYENFDFKMADEIYIYHIWNSTHKNVK
ncbi:MAG: GNAT family N-acetyltransferase [Bacteroides sp.]|nr:GNAT family N-acetyltransferase [Bacteroides sp.]